MVFAHHDQTLMTAFAPPLDSLSSALVERLTRGSFDAERWLGLARSLREPGAAEKREQQNRFASGTVQPPRPEEISKIDPAERARLAEVGAAALARGELAFCVMAGGMATRMGGVVKALVTALPGHTFLSLRLGENRTLSKRAGRAVPLWLMTSEATDGPIREALVEAGAPPHVQVFRQDLSLRMTRTGELFRDDAGEPSTYATGHGDLVDALRRSGYLDAFVAAGGKYVWIANLDNLGACVDEAVLGAFIESHKSVMVEVCEKAPGDRGGIPARVHDKVQILEEFRLPKDFDADAVRVFNTNTFLVKAEPLRTAPIDWNWFYVEKKVGTTVCVQFERLLQELTAALDAGYLLVPREGSASRFVPVKDHEELARRQDEISAVARLRGMV